MPLVWNFVTDFGDSGVTVPLALLTLVFLVSADQLRLAFSWALAIGGCAIAIIALKLVFGACSTPLMVGRIVSPSGHAAMSTAVYGSLALLVGVRWPRKWRRAVMVALAAAILGIALSRVALHDHSRAEIVVGLVVGAGAVWVFRARLRRHEASALPVKWLLLSGAALIAVMHGTRWMIEPTLQRLAWDFRLDLPWCR